MNWRTKGAKKAAVHKNLSQSQLLLATQSYMETKITPGSQLHSKKTAEELKQ